MSVELGTVVQGYTFLSEIGREGSVIHYHVRNVRSDFMAKVEPVKIHGLDLFDLYLPNENESLMKMCHQRVTRIYARFVEGDNMFLILEYCSNGSLYDYIKRMGFLSRSKLDELVPELVSAVKYMHKQGVMHCDIRPHNVFLDDKFHAKLGNFGVSKRVNERVMDNWDVMSSARVMSTFAAPETNEQSCYDAVKADIWSMAITALFAATATTAWDVMSPDVLAEKVSQGDRKLFGAMGVGTVNAIKGMLNYDPDNRTLPKDGELERKHLLIRQPALSQQPGQMQCSQMFGALPVIGTNQKLVRKVRGTRSGVFVGSALLTIPDLGRPVAKLGPLAE